MNSAKNIDSSRQDPEWPGENLAVRFKDESVVFYSGESEIESWDSVKLSNMR